MKIKRVWYCTSCGHKQLKWSGQCPTCLEWNSLSEEIERPARSSHEKLLPTQRSQPSPLSSIEKGHVERYSSCFSELDQALGGGMVPGSLILIGGDPGIGKSTLCLHLADSLGLQNKKVLYVSGEESLEQIAMRAERLHTTSDQILFSNETEVGEIIRYLTEYTPPLAIIDSIQILYKADIPSSPGSVTQVRECTAALMQAAKSLHITLIIIGHVTKAGEIAGPLVRSIKNRFGPTDEIAVFHMKEGGLKEVKNPSKIFIEDRAKGTAGAVIMPMMEGSRPILIEAQALVTKTFYPSPSRKCTGLDPNRLALLLAVCEKRARFRLYQSDVFVSITGGMKITEPAADLGLMLAIISSFTNKVFDAKTTVIGEVGLGGEIRAVPRVEARVKEAIQMGFSRCLLPIKNIESVKSLQNSIALCPIHSIDDAIDLCF
jgi:DNA repair protein RadA/Sms